MKLNTLEPLANRFSKNNMAAEKSRTLMCEGIEAQIRCLRPVI
jgi:hypothetical protein